METDNIDREANLDSQIKAELERIKAKDGAAVELTESKEDTDEVSTSEEKSQTDPHLEEALKMGYNPNYSGPNKKSPEQFVKDGSYFRKIDAQKKEIDDLKKMFIESEERYVKLEKIKKEQAIQDLEDQKLQAIDEGDRDRYNRVNSKQQEEYVALNELAKPVVHPPVLPVEITEFVKANEDWMNTYTPENELMAKTADGLLSVIAEEAKINGESITLTEQLKRVKVKVEAIFPHRFKNVNKEKPAMVASSSESSSERKTLAGRLSAEQKRTLEKARQYGSKLTNEEYAKRLELTGELRDE